MLTYTHVDHVDLFAMHMFFFLLCVLLDVSVCSSRWPVQAVSIILGHVQRVQFELC